MRRYEGNRTKRKGAPEGMGGEKPERGHLRQEGRERDSINGKKIPTDLSGTSTA